MEESKHTAEDACKENQEQQLEHDKSISNRRPSAVKSKYLNWILEDQNEIENQPQEENEEISAQFSNILANLIKVQEDFHEKDEVKVQNEEFGSGISQQITQRKHSKFVNKTAALTNLAKSQNVGLISKNKVNEKWEYSEEVAGSKTLRKIGTPDLASVNKYKQAQNDQNQKMFNDTYKEMIKSNITSFREAVDIANNSKYK